MARRTHSASKESATVESTPTRAKGKKKTGNSAEDPGCSGSSNKNIDKASDSSRDTVETSEVLHAVSKENPSPVAGRKKRSRACEEAVVIPPPAVSLFAKLQAKSSDFTTDWLLLQEDETTTSSVEPPISAELLEKLRQHQIARQKRRDAPAPTSATTNGAEGRICRSGDGKKARRKNGSIDTDEEYEPPCVPTTEGVPAQQSKGDEALTRNSSSVASSNSLGSEAGAVDGFTEEFLSFKKASDGKAMEPQPEVHARVTLAGGTRVLAMADRCANKQDGGDDRDTSALQSCSVPLWCVERLTNRIGYASHPLIALHQEICDFVKYFHPTEAEISMRCLIEAEVAAIAKRLWPKCEPVVFGSMSTQLLLPLSDIDITILNVPVPTEEALVLLAGEISTAGLCQTAYPQLILKTKVPLVKFQHRDSLLDVDISINAEDGQRNTSIVIDLLKRYPEARPLTVVVKYFLLQRGMDEPYHGGLGSFAVTLLVISFLQNHPIYTTCPEERAYSGLGRLLVDFFRYYGMLFRYDRCGLSVQGNGTCFPRTDVTGPSSLSMAMGGNNSSGRCGAPGGAPQVLIEDPGCSNNNAASSLRSFHVITFGFTYAYRALTAVIENPTDITLCSPSAVDIGRRPTLLSRIIHVDAETAKRREAVVAAHAVLMRDPESRARLEQAARYHEERREFVLKTLPSLVVAPHSDASVSRKRSRQHDVQRVTSSDESNESLSSNASSVRKEGHRDCR